MATNDFQNVDLSGGGGGSGTGMPNTTVLAPLGGGQDDAPQITAAIEAARVAGGGIVLLSAGDYTIKQTISPGFIDYMCDVHVRGTPETSLTIAGGLVTGSDPVFNFPGFPIGNGKAISNITVGDTSITLTNHSDASSYAAGDILLLSGTDVHSIDDVEYVIASAAGNVTSGVVTLRAPVMKTMTSVTLTTNFGYETSQCSYQNNSLEDLNIELTSASASDSIRAIFISYQQNFLLKNIIIRGWNQVKATVQTGTVTLQSCFRPIVDNVRVEYSKNECMELTDCYGASVRNCDLLDGLISGGGNSSSLRLSKVWDSAIERNNIYRSGTSGIGMHGSIKGRRNVVQNNTIFNCVLNGIEAGIEMVIANNTIERCVQAGI